MRILLVKPKSFSVGFTSLARVAPLDLLMVAASVPKHKCEILDMRLEKDTKFEQELIRFRPNLIGLTAYTAEAEPAKALARRAKKILPEVSIVWGGHHATLAVDDVLDEPSVDFVVRGEGEITFPTLVEAIAIGAPLENISGIAFRKEQERAITPARPQIPNLDSLPFPDWNLVVRYQGKYYLSLLGACGSVETTRGCPFNCDFCSVWVFHQRRYRQKSPDRVIKELKRLPEGIQTVLFVDDEFWVDARRSLELATLIGGQNQMNWKGAGWAYAAQVRTDDIVQTPQLAEQWAKVGLKVLLLGIESCKEKELKELYHKRATVNQAIEALEIMRKYGVEAWGAFIVNPEWSEEDFLALQEFIIRNEIAFPQITVLTPLPGTVLENKLFQEGKIKAGGISSSLFDLLHVTFPQPRLPLRQFYECLAELYQKTSMRANLRIFRRAIRNRIISKDWLRSEMGQRAHKLLSQLTDVEAYLEAHRALGEKV